MSTRNGKKWEAALRALAEPARYGSVAAIGRAVGVPVRTLHRWRSDPGFLAELRALQADHAPAETQSDGTPGELPATSDGVLTMVMAELHRIGTDARTPGYVRVQALARLADLVVEVQSVRELRQQLAELENGG